MNLAEKKKQNWPSRIRKPWGAIVILLLLVAGSGAFAYYKYSSAAILPTNTYTWYNWPQNSGGLNSLEWTLTPLTDSSTHGYFYSHQFWFENGDIGYFGIQTLGHEPTGKIAIFSIWNALDVYGPEYGKPFGGEGVGLSARISYPWVPGKSYRLRMGWETSTADGHWWNAHIRELPSGEERYVGRIKVQPSWGKILPSQSVFWTEHYSGDRTSCTSMPTSKVRISDVTANFGVLKPISYNHTLQDNTNCHSTSYIFDVPGGTEQWMASQANPNYDATVQAVNTPSSVKAGQTFTASFNATNTGLDEWTAAKGYTLGSQSPENNNTWGAQRIALPSNVSVPRGSSHNFTRTFTAPATPGTYTFAWKMLREGVTWFGNTPSTTITVTPNTTQYDANVVINSAPSSARTGSKFNATLTATNKGTEPWTNAKGFSLGSQNPENNGRWGVSRIALPSNVTVNQNQTHQFSHSFTAPSTPGTYSFDWKMLREGVAWFGNTASKTIQIVPLGKGDVNNDGLVNSADLGIVLSYYNFISSDRSKGDLNSDGKISGLDLSEVISNFSQ